MKERHSSPRRMPLGRLGTLFAQHPERSRRVRRSLQNYVVVALLVPLVLVAACTQSQMRRAAIIMRDFSLALEKVQDAMIAAHSDGFLDDAEHKRIQALIDQIALAGEEAVNTLRAGSGSSLSTGGKGAALAKLDIALMGIDHLTQEGVLHIKNPASRSAAGGLILSLRGIVRTAQALLQ